MELNKSTLSRLTSPPRELLTTAFNNALDAVTSKGAPEEILERHNCKRASVGDRRVLVAYYTRHGSTSSVAERIATELSLKGFKVDLRSVTTISPQDDISVYDAYVLGSAVYWSAVTPEIVDFFTAHAEIIAAKPLAFFAVCGTLIRDTEKNRGSVDSYIAGSFEGIPLFKPIDVGRFAGKIQLEKLTLFERVVMQGILTIWRLPGGDHRDLGKVSSWARGVGTTIARSLEERDASTN